MATKFGAVAAGHPLTAQAAEEVLRSGGNAFDASIAALSAACVVEPALASLGGGGFSTVLKPGYRPKVIDFFSQTPIQRCADDDLDFRSIRVDFGAASQVFHVGLGSVAVPGVIRGLFALHDELATMPMRELLSPAISYAKEGVRLSEFQAYTIELLTDIFSSTPQSMTMFGSDEDAERLLTEGEVMHQPLLADVLEAVAYEGADLFYQGEIGQRLTSDMRSGGHLTLEDLRNYEVVKRDPCESTYHHWRVLTNPPPSSGGSLITFALQLLTHVQGTRFSFGSVDHLQQLINVMEVTSEAKIEALLDDTTEGLTNLLEESFFELWKEKIAKHPKAYRGTTHISIIDAIGNAAASTLSNGEGSAYVVPGTGIMLNNMLGEDDLAPLGLHRWPTDTRLTSMMAPTILTEGNKNIIAIGSGGSSRIRSAILQVISNLIDYEMDCEQAVGVPRIHYENEMLSIEGGFDMERLAPLLESNATHQLFDSSNLFFGGVHVVMSDGDRFQGAGDPRRAGVFVSA